MDLQPIETKQDHRGLLAEAFKLPKDGQVFYVIINPGEMRGGHYHLRKTENFLVIYGSGVISVKNRETGDTMKVEVSGSKPISVKIVPNHTHHIVANEEGCILLVWVDEIFDEKDADTYQEEL